MTCRMPVTLSSTDSVALRPPMSVRTQPGCMTMAISPSAPHVGASSRKRSFSAALDSPYVPRRRLLP